MHEFCTPPFYLVHWQEMERQKKIPPQNASFLVLKTDLCMALAVYVELVSSL